MQNLCAGLNESAKIIHENNKAKGFWDKNYSLTLCKITRLKADYAT